MMDKKLVRAELTGRLKELSKPVYEDLSYRIANQLYEDPLWKSAQVIGITVSRFPEVDTYQIIRKAWEQKKKVVIPKCDPKTRGMTFRMLQRFNELESVFFGLYEPIENRTIAVKPNEINLLIVPGVAYTRDGFRIGFGGGYYDRFLEGFKGDTLSLAFSFQIVSKLPLEEHDLPVSKIITENEVISVVY
ncbi:5-formyltetrahydrofolate cyclo-ligase [Bacillus aquiflavi]|nr:5-formyltetrahydrofolate cyclo-ligase [Bacillus aquiflavi]MBA4535824.1 5-formyltetrahydrofolate cyclo-ligase [Bacillus aquiflavi]UAC47251.1 5-formyltetrahydrofolate cyclo-ligase [Bacillus aquiflavi]